MISENKNKKYILAPSILSADFTCLGEEIRAVLDAGAQWIHYDVMDGMFVPNISVGIPVLKSIRRFTDCTLDVHLMIEEPDRYVEDFAAAGADVITVHAEACRHLDSTVRHIRDTGVRCGVALNPATTITTLDYVLSEVDMVLLMSVNPGFGGQKFILYTIDKLQALAGIRRTGGLDFDIEVDGGVTLSNAGQLLEAGADILVAGSAVFGGDKARNVRQFMEIIKG